MTKNDLDDQVKNAARKLHMLVGEMLFGARNWPPEPQIINAAWDALSLDERVDSRTFRLNKVGASLNGELFRIWLGALEIGQILVAMQDHGFLSVQEAEQFFERMDAGQEFSGELRMALQRSYRTYFGHTSLH
jgi:hypothetical protein